MNIIAISNNLYKETNLYDKENFIFIHNKDDLTFEYLSEINPEYIFFPHWSYIIPKEIYENFNCVIFHITDLPFGRGGSPLQNLLERKIYQTKISAIKCVKEIDAGDIYLKKDFDISSGNATEIFLKAGSIISNMIEEIIQTKRIPTPQQGEIIHFKRRTPSQSNLAHLQDLESVYNYIRMLDAEAYPSAFLEHNNIKYEFTHVEYEGSELIARVRIKTNNKK